MQKNCVKNFSVKKIKIIVLIMGICDFLEICPSFQILLYSAQNIDTQIILTLEPNSAVLFSRKSGNLLNLL